MNAIPTAADFDPALVQSFKANRAAIDAAGHYDRNSFVRRALFDFAVKFHDADPVKILVPVADNAKIEFAKRIAGNCLTEEERAGLAIYLIDSIDRISTDLRIEAESVLADILSGVRF